MDAGGRATQEAKAEGSILMTTPNQSATRDLLHRYRQAWQQRKAMTPPISRHPPNHPLAPLGRGLGRGGDPNDAPNTSAMKCSSSPPSWPCLGEIYDFLG